METTKVCSRCLRALRNSVKTLQSSQTASTSKAQLRLFSSQRLFYQQQEQQKTAVPPQIPTTTGTVTSNVAPPAPTKTTSGTKATLPLLDASVAEMQRRIGQSLTPDSVATQLAKRLRKSARGATESYMTYGTTEAMFKSCALQAPYTIPEDQRMGLLTGQGPPKTAGGEDLGHPEAKSWWFDTIGLDPTFSTWSQVTYLHMYLLTVRLRTVDDQSTFTNYQRYLLEHFSQAAEDKMLLIHNMGARGIRNKYLKDLFLQWRGILAAYDEGLVQGDAVLAGAVWRNLFKGDEDVDWVKVATVVQFMRQSLRRLAAMDTTDIVNGLNGPQGLWAASHTSLINEQSRGFAEPLTH